MVNVSHSSSYPFLNTYYVSICLFIDDIQFLVLRLFQTPCIQVCNMATNYVIYIFSVKFQVSEAVKAFNTLQNCKIKSIFNAMFTKQNCKYVT